MGILLLNGFYYTGGYLFLYPMSKKEKISKFFEGVPLRLSLLLTNNYFYRKYYTLLGILYCYNMKMLRDFTK